MSNDAAEQPTAQPENHSEDLSQAKFRDPSLPIPQRVDDLMARMTLAEKVGQMMQLDAKGDVEDVIVNKLVGSVLHVPPSRSMLVHELVAKTRLQIPMLVADDCIHGYSFWPGGTVLPTQLGMACSFDPELVRAGARMTAREIAPTGVHWTFSPVLCLARDLRWGRIDETFGEDPYLLSVLGQAMVEGYQGDGLDDPDGVLACAKHFAGYSETLGGRDASEADLSKRKLRSWFLPPFEAAAKAGARTFMLGYSAIDGVPVTVNRWLLNDVLRGEWGWDGVLVTDWDNVGNLVKIQKLAADHAHGAALAVDAGNDFVMATPEFFEGAQQAVRDGLISEEQIDGPVRRILTLKMQMGLFENPRLPDEAREKAVIGAPENRELALQQSRRGLVLLRNDGILPLDPDQPLKLALVGGNADDVDAQLGDWAGASGQQMSQGQPRELTETVRDGLTQLLPKDWTLNYSRGGGVTEDLGRPWIATAPKDPAAPETRDEAALQAAIDAAKDSDVTVVVIGDDFKLAGEGRSTATLELVGPQRELLDRVAGLGKPYVVVVISSKPLVLPPSALEANALIQAFNPGSRGGLAIAELILGQIEPSGRLPISFARHVGQQPVYYNVVAGQHGTTYADLTQDPAFVFGEGLGYTSFEYSDLSVETPQLGADDVLRATVTVTNTGQRPGLETVQAYISDLVTSATWAAKELKGFWQVQLEPGQSRQVAIEIPASSCSIVNAEGKRVVEPGDFDLLVGHSSRDADLQRVRFSIG